MRRVQSAGHRVVAVDGDPAAVGFAVADEWACIDFGADVDAVAEFAARASVSGVLAISTDRAVPVAAELAERLGLAGPGRETARAMTDKAVMRATLERHGLAQPRFAVVGEDADLRAALAQVGLPAVLKPVDSGGQRGLSLCLNEHDLERALAAARAFSPSGRVLLESYISGSELNAIVVACDGIAEVVTLSDRLRPPGIGFGVGWAHLYPSTLAPQQLERAGDVARRAVEVLGLQNGIAFPQLLARGDEIFVVEVAARIPAGQMADLVRIGTGVDLVAIAVDLALGLPVERARCRPRYEQPLAIRFLTAKPGVLPTGRVVAIEGLERIAESPGIVKTALYMQVGETIRPVQVDADRRGYVIAVANDATRALTLADRAAKELKVTAV